MPAGLCPPRRRERAVPVASPSPGAPASRARTFLRLSHARSGLPPRSRRARRPQRGPHGAAAAAPGVGGGVGGCPAAPPPSPATTRGCRGPARRPSRRSKETQLQEVGQDSLEVRRRPERCVAEEKPPLFFPPSESSSAVRVPRPRSPYGPAPGERAGQAGGSGVSRCRPGARGAAATWPSGAGRNSRLSRRDARRHAGKSHVPVNRNAGQPPACHWSADNEREIQLKCYVLQCRRLRDGV